MLISEKKQARAAGVLFSSSYGLSFIFYSFFPSVSFFLLFFFLLLTICAKIALYERIQNEMGCNEFYANAAHTLTQI